MISMGVVLQYVYNVKIDNLNNLIDSPDISYFENTMTLSPNEVALSSDAAIVFRDDNTVLGSLSSSSNGGVTLAR